MDKRITILDIKAKKATSPIVCLTAYTSSIAKIIDPYCDIVLVGDSLGMVIYGMESTLPVTMDMMINHGRAVVASTSKAFVVIDMPFASYQSDSATAFNNAALIMKNTNCQAVKLEGGVEIADTIAHLTRSGIPVMAHVGLKPQSVNIYGNYMPRGQTKEEQKNILNDAKIVEEAGAFAVVVENVPDRLAEKITSSLKIPTIGIGASCKCDGQILVIDDMLGLSEKTPKFVKKYSNLSQIISSAVEQYAKEVKEKSFPSF